MGGWFIFKVDTAKGEKDKLWASTDYLRTKKLFRKPNEAKENMNFGWKYFSKGKTQLPEGFKIKHIL